MRKYEDEQNDSVMFSGDKAQRIIALRQSMDSKAEEICKQLHAAVDLAERQFADLGKKYQSQFVSELKGSELESVPIEEIGFDFSNAEKHGIVFAKQKSSPVVQFLRMLRSLVEDGPNPTSDHIIVEPKDSKAFNRWDQRVPA